MTVRLYIFSLLLVALWSCNKPHPSSTSIQTEVDSVSYALGADISRHYQEQGLNLNPDLIYQGFRDKSTNASLEIGEQEIEEILTLYANKIEQKKQEALEKLAQENLAEQQRFLEENQEKEGIILLPSGLQYKILEKGVGKPPNLDNRVLVSYEGKLLNGDLFTPAGERDLQLSEMIPGLQEALTLMRPGDRWELYVPSELAWGTQSRSQIPPNSLLIFDLKVIQIR